ncbi:MAG: hypothetical protein U0231_20190 [Nitrospiraceae bacterium]
MRTANDEHRPIGQGKTSLPVVRPRVGEPNVRTRGLIKNEIKVASPELAVIPEMRMQVECCSARS